MKKWLGLLMVVMILTGCAKTASVEDMHHNDLIDVQLTWDREIIGKDDKVTFSTDVLQNGSVVLDADEVEYEIWLEGTPKDQREKVVVKINDEKYQLEKTFTETGTYFVIVHVTARGVHSMPKKTFVVE